MIPPGPLIAISPLLVLILFFVTPPRIAICVSIMGAYLFLPERFGLDLPLLPPFNKHTIPGLVAVIVLLGLYGRSNIRRGTPTEDPQEVLPGWLPRSKTGIILIVILLTGPLFTALTNGDPLRFVNRTVPGLRIYDAVALASTTMVSLLPLFLARKFLATDKGHMTLLMALVVFAFAYSFLAAYEIRMSPRLNEFVYGFRGSAWRQHIRGDGFRPFVFLQHGLWLGIFMTSAVVASVVALRHTTGTKQKVYLIGMGLWIFVVLFLSKAFGAFVIALVLLPIAFFLPVRLQLMMAAGLAIIVLLFPAARTQGLVPTDRIVAMAGQVEAERGRSLQFRLNNEDVLLTKASQRPLFGWGGWARSRVYNENGQDISTTDGRWIIVLGEAGWYGYIGQFGLMAFPILVLAFRARHYKLSVATSGLCLALVANMIDLIPNGTLTQITWLMSGALLGRLETERQTTSDAAPETQAPDGARRTVSTQGRRGASAKPVRGSYTRFPPAHSR